MMQLKTEKTINKRSGTVLITGDAWCLKEDLMAFYMLYADVPRETFCINRSIMSPYIVGDCKHWGVADADESVWFSEHLKRMFPEITRHTLKDAALDDHFDYSWSPDGKDVTEWKGNSALMAVLICDALGYDHIVLAGCPLTNGAHWYDHQHHVEWTPEALKIWEDYKNYKVRSMSGFTRFLYGGPDARS